ncbi:hypothetical protein RZS08_64350, partial [Arthrospira platensis SPKY1]|nr:hypothetical protein [Arthrospira platensis SPKY1]
DHVAHAGRGVVLTHREHVVRGHRRRVADGEGEGLADLGPRGVGGRHRHAVHTRRAHRVISALARIALGRAADHTRDRIDHQTRRQVVCAVAQIIAIHVGEGA